MPEVAGWLLDPYQFAFMRRALLVLAIISVVGGIVGSYVVHKGLAFSGDALAHSTLVGVAVAFVGGASITFGALVAGLVTALGIGWTRERARVSYDTAIGITFVAMFALGIVVMSTRRGYTPDLFSFVFGNILGVTRGDLVGAAVLAAGVLLFIAAFHREMMFVAYDPAMAAASGVSARFFQYALLALIAVAVVVALKAIGIVLVNAMLIVPAATAALVSHRLTTIMGLGVLAAFAASLLGLHLAYYANVAASASIVLAAAALFLLTLAATSWRAHRASQRTA
jgi:manganese/iron transport system permease protein